MFWNKFPQESRLSFTSSFTNMHSQCSKAKEIRKILSIISEYTYISSGCKFACILKPNAQYFRQLGTQIYFNLCSIFYVKSYITLALWCMNSKLLYEIFKQILTLHKCQCTCFCHGFCTYTNVFLLNQIIRNLAYLILVQIKKSEISEKPCYRNHAKNLIIKIFWCIRSTFIK